MADKQPSLRKIFRRGRNKSPADDPSDSDNSSNSCLRADVDSSSDRLSPYPVPRAPSLSPSARIPKKLQKKRTSSDSSSPLASPASLSQQGDRPPAGEFAKHDMTAASRRDSRRKARGQSEYPIAARSQTKKEAAESSTSSMRTSRNDGSGSTWPCKAEKAAPSSSGNHRDRKKHLTVKQRHEESDAANSDLEDLGSLSPMSTKSEPAMSGKNYIHSERRKSAGPLVDMKPLDQYKDLFTIPIITIRLPDVELDLLLDLNLAIAEPDYLDSDARGRDRLRRGREKRRLARTPSVSPAGDRSTQPDDSPVSSLSDSSDGMSADRDAPLLPHERTTSTNASSSTPDEKKTTSSSDKSSVFLSPNDARTRLQKNQIRIPRPERPLPKPTPKGTNENNDRNDNAPRGTDDDLPAAGILDAAAAEAALIETLEKINSNKRRADDDDDDEIITASTRDVIRKAAAVLDLGPRDQKLPLPRPRVPSSGSRAMRTMLLQQQQQEDQQEQGSVGGGGEKRVVAHPTKVQYDQPTTLAGGIVQRGFRRWRCCCCKCFTHYEDHVCSKLACMHVRCEGKCEAFEP